MFNKPCYIVLSSLKSSTSLPNQTKMEPQSRKILCEFITLTLHLLISEIHNINLGSRPKLKDTFKELFPLATDWKIIGGLLGLEKHVLNKIKAEEEGVRNCLYEMLSEWLKQVHPPPTWAALADAVETVDEHKAIEIRERNASPSSS